MSGGGGSQNGQPTSATPGAPLDLKRNIPPAGHSLHQQPPQDDHTLRGAPPTNNDRRARSNDNLSASKHSKAAGHSLHTATLHAQHSNPPSRSLDWSRPPASMQSPSRLPMSTTSQNRSGRGHRPTASNQPSRGGIFSCCISSCRIFYRIFSCIFSCCKGNMQ